MLPDPWDDSATSRLDEVDLLVHRSRLLGSDLRITNWGGGNTSAKLEMPDPVTGKAVTVLFVKGSGGDLGSIHRSGFATLELAKCLALEARYRGRAHEDEMVELLPHCAFGASPRPASIDTPLHAYLPFAHVDHVHPDAVIALATTRRSRELVREVFAGELGWLPWQRPGFDLALRLRDLVDASPGLAGVVLAGHGLFTWGPSSRECYHTTLRVIRRAQEWLDERTAGRPAFGGVAVKERSAIGADRLLELRGRLSEPERKVAHFDHSPEVLEFVCARRLRELAAAGTSCPDHFLRTKVRPLVLEGDVETALASYRSEYAAYYERCRGSESPPMRDPSPVVCLIPGVGLVAFAREKGAARIAAEFFASAIRVMRGASGVDDYAGIPEQEAFDVEYWSLEEAKLRRAPPPKPLAGRVALVTGGGGAIGRACAARLLADGACAVLVDLDADSLAEAREELASRFGADAVRTACADVTDEASVAAAFGTAVREYGGLDVLVACAGLAASAPIQETSLGLWQKTLDVLATGYFLAAREAFRTLRAQGLGGSIVFVASKNALVASPGAAAYGAAKAAELQLARSLALEGAPFGIRVNSVNPDAVLRGSKIWSGAWREERARAHGIAPDALEEHYRERSLLGRSVLPEDVAEAVCFFASDASSKSTGNLLNVDAGNAAAFPR